MTDFKNIRGESPRVESDVEPVRYIAEGAYGLRDLPLRDGPLRFALMNSDGASSESWLVRVTNRGDVYIICREADLDIKVSLHESGEQKVTYRATWQDTSEYHDWRWREHRHYRDNRARPSFALMFPNYGLCLDEEWRRDHPNTWLSRHLLVQAPHPPLAMLVAFVVTDEDVDIPEHVGYAVLAELRTRPGKKVCVVAGHTPEDRISSMLQDGLERMMSESSAEDISASFDEPFRVFGLRFPKKGEGGPWLLTLPVKLDRSI